MDSGKLDDSLSLALDVPENLRKETQDLGSGYDEDTQTWELIIRYHGDIEGVVRELDAQAVILTGGYAILTIKQDKIRRLSDFEEIEYIEQPKKLEFALSEGVAASCVEPLQRGADGLFGNGIICAVIDSGIDYAHPDFRNEDGSTRILALWDQVQEGTPPEGFIRGRLFSQQEIDASLESMQESFLPVGALLSIDTSGHGTHVTGICAGNGRASNGRYTGVAPKSGILVVKLGDSVGKSFPRTTNLMEAVEFVVNFAIERAMPIAINISFGNSYGSHSGRSLVETYMDNMATVWKSVICIGTGNEGGTGRHKGGFIKEGEETVVELAVGTFETSMNLQIWKNYFDDFDLEIISPSERSSGALARTLGSNEFELENTRILFYYGSPRPYNGLQEIYMEWIPMERYIPSGIWKFRFIPKKIIDGEYAMWIPSGAQLSPQTRFLRPTENTTLTIPSTTPRAVSVGAYDSFTDSYAYFSGRGFTWKDQWKKPDIAAPGVNITSCAVGGGYSSRSGTSMATPFVTGGSALLLEWGIVKGNDPYLYGEKVKAYLINGARQLPGFTEWPNQQVGYGALCVSQSIPR